MKKRTKLNSVVQALLAAAWMGMIVDMFIEAVVPGGLRFGNSLAGSDLLPEIRAAAKWGYRDLGLRHPVIVAANQPRDVFAGGHTADAVDLKTNFLGFRFGFRSAGAVQVPGDTERYRELGFDPGRLTESIFHELVHAQQHAAGRLYWQDVVLPAGITIDAGAATGEITAAGAPVWNGGEPYLKLRIADADTGADVHMWWRLPDRLDPAELQREPEAAVRKIVRAMEPAAVILNNRVDLHGYRTLPWEAEAYAVSAAMLERYEAERGG